MLPKKKKKEKIQKEEKVVEQKQSTVQDNYCFTNYSFDESTSLPA